jgi:hypothetical protein
MSIERGRNPCMLAVSRKKINRLASALTQTFREKPLDRRTWRCASPIPNPATLTGLATDLIIVPAQPLSKATLSAQRTLPQQRFSQSPLRGRERHSRPDDRRPGDDRRCRHPLNALNTVPLRS